MTEGKAIEYKLTLELKDSKSQATLLKEITAFANGSGGDLLYGIEAKDGLPTAVSGLQALNFDATVLQLQNLIRSHVQPRLFGVRFRSVPLANGAAVLAIRVPRASGPFMLENRFYLRTGPEARPMDFVEVSRAFFESEATSNQLRNFRFERCAAILANEAPLEMRDKSFIVLHVVPLESVGQPHRFNIQELLQWYDGLWPMNSSGANYAICLDGVLKYNQSAETKTHSTYAMLMRSGAIESVEGAWLRERQDKEGNFFAHYSRWGR